MADPERDRAREREAETAEQLATIIGGKGTVVMMNGTAGAPLSDAREKLAEAVEAEAAAVLAAEMGMNIALPCRIVRRRARAAPLSRCKCGRICVSHLT